MGAAGLYTNLSADRYIVAVDVNPSVELSVNGLDRISAVTLKNDDAKALIDEASLKGKELEYETNGFVLNLVLSEYVNNILSSSHIFCKLTICSSS